MTVNDIGKYIKDNALMGVILMYIGADGTQELFVEPNEQPAQVSIEIVRLEAAIELLEYRIMILENL